MELVLEGGHRVDSNDTEALEKAAAMLEQEALENATTLDMEKAAEKGELTPEKARKILKDGEVHGKPLTEQQRKYFGAVAGGTARKSEADDDGISIGLGAMSERLADGLDEMAKAKRSLQAPKEWWDKTIKAVAATPKYKGYKRERLAKIVGDIWTGLDDKKKKEIRGRYGKEFGAAVEKSDDAGESLEETSTKELTATLDDIKARLKKKPGDAALKKRYAAISLELGARRRGKTSKSMTAIEALEEFAKGGPYIGPRGGKWADAKHTIPWGEKKPSKPKKEPAKATRAKRDAAANAIRDMFHSGRYNGRVPDKDAKVIFASKRWAKLYGKGVVKKEWQELAKEGHMRKEGNTWVWGLAVKSLTAWINEQETDMTNENTDLTKALGDDAELAKGMMGYGVGKRVLEWADQFYTDTGLEKEALQCVKDMIACQKKWDAFHKAEKPWREFEEMPKTQREAYRTKRSKERDVLSKEEDAIRMKMRDLESKLVDYRFKEASVRQAMGKSGVETLSDFAKGDDAEPASVEEATMSGTEILQDYLEKAQGMPSGEPGMGRGPEDGADLSRVKGPTGSVDSSAGPPIGEPKAKKKKLSEDDDEVEAQLKGRKKPIERMTGKSMAVPGHQREMVAHENAQVVSRLRKGPDDITLGPGIPAPVVEPEPVAKANRWVQGEDSLVVYSDTSDAAAARLVKGEDFYAGGQAPALGRNPMVLTQRKRCTACEAIMSKSLSVCPHCGDGAGVQKQGALRIAVSAVRNGPGLRPSRGEGDITIS